MEEALLGLRAGGSSDLRKLSGRPTASASVAEPNAHIERLII